MIFKSHDEAIDFFAELNGRLDFNCINTLEEPDEVFKLHKGLVEECIESYYDYMCSVYNNPDLQEDTEKIGTVLGQIESLSEMLSVLRLKVSMARLDRTIEKFEEREPFFDGSFENSIVFALKSDIKRIKDLIIHMRYGGFENVKYVFSVIEDTFNRFKSKFSSLMDEFCYFEFVEVVHEWITEAELIYKDTLHQMRMHFEVFGVFSKLDIKVEWEDSSFEFDRNLPQEYNSCWDWSYIEVHLVKDESTFDTGLLTFTPLIEPVLLLGVGDCPVVSSVVFRPVEASLNSILLFGGFVEGVEAIEPIV